MHRLDRFSWKPTVGIVLTLVATAANAQAGKPQLSTPITYTTVAVPLERAMDEIGKTAGVKLSVDQELANEPVILRLDKVPLQDCLDRIAHGIGAEWKPIQGGYQLERSDEMLSKLQAADIDRRASEIKKSIADLESTAQKNGRLTPERAQNVAQQLVEFAKQRQSGTRAYWSSARKDLYSAFPKSRLLTQLISVLDPREIASLAPGGRFVYAINPTAVQRPLSDIDPQWIQDFCDDTNTLSSAVEAEVKKPEAAGLSEDLASQYPLIQTSPSRVLVIVRPWVMNDRVQISMQLYDAKGNALSGYQTDLASTFDPFTMRPQEDKARRESKTTGIKLSDRAMQITNRVIKGYNDPSQVPKLDDETLQEILNPTKFDPLSFVTSEIVLGLATQANANVVFLPTDETEALSRVAAMNGFVNWDLFQTSLARNGEMDLSLSDGWLIGKPISPLKAAYYRCPRPAEETYAQSLAKAGFTSIDDLADLVLAMPHGSGLGPADDLSSLVLGPKTAMHDIVTEEGLRLWASLSDQQKSAAVNGLTISYNMLDKDQLQLLDDFVFLGFKELEPVPSMLKGLSQDQIEQLYNSSERTEQLPNGVPLNSALEVKDEPNVVFFLMQQDDRGNSFERTCGIPEMAADYAQTQRVDLFPFMAKMSISDIRIGQQRHITLTAHLGDRYLMSEQIDENHKSDAGGVGLMDVRSILSGDQLAEFDKQVSKLMDQWKNRKPGDFNFLDEEPPPPAKPPLSVRL